MSVASLRARLLYREHPAAEVEAAIAHLLETRDLDDDRVARAYARTAASVKGRGRLRVMRELSAMGLGELVPPPASGSLPKVLQGLPMGAGPL